MFTGLIEEIGLIQGLEPIGEGFRLSIQTHKVTQNLARGDSIAVNGVCLTVIENNGEVFVAEAVAETRERTTLVHLRTGERVNLERALQPQNRLAGHFVQGHIDGIGQVVDCIARAPGFWLQIHLPNELANFVVEKGSIAVDGVSLTVADIKDDIVAIAVIPHTADQTTLGRKKTNDLVNIEVDILGKYVFRFLQKMGVGGDISQEKLQQWGY